jgi:RimJ/RimL family protein N-acetyltransferase
MDDIEILYEWRNDPLTRSASLETNEVKLDEHREWLRDTLARADRKLHIAEREGEPVGIVRLDFHGDACEMSWTVAPSARGHGIGKLMVSAMINRIGGLITARIRTDNAASVAIARAAGMVFQREDGELTYWKIDLGRRKAG